MHFIERLFGLSPDGGSGMLEALIFCAAILISGLVLWKMRASREARR
jgi:hypothetical protein